MTENRNIVILGSGPTAAGAILALQDHGVRDIVVLEREGEAGGVPRHCGHSGFGVGEFRLGHAGLPITGPTFAHALRHIAEKAELRLRHTVRTLHPGGSLDVVGPEGNYRLRANAVLLAMGAREMPRSSRLIGGTRPQGVMTTGALQQWVYLEKRSPANRIVVIGSELVAFSAILTCRHAGIEIAAIIDEGSRTFARWPCGPLARSIFGIPVLLNTHVREIFGGDRVAGVQIEQDGKTSKIRCDGVVVSGRFVPETALLKGGHIVLDPGSAGPEIDEYWRTSDIGYFAAGNLVHPIETSGRCFADGRAAGEAMAAALADRLPSPASRRIKASGAMKYLYPQRLAGPGPATFYGRVKEEKRGHLIVRLDGRTVWSRAAHLLPERRVRLPASAFKEDFAEAEVEFA